MTKSELREMIRECLREELDTPSLKEDIKHLYYHEDPGGLKRGQWLDVKEEDGRTLAKWNFNDNWRDITDDIEELPYHHFHGARPAKTFTWGGWRYWLDDEVEKFWDIEGSRIIGDFDIPGMPHVKRKTAPEASLTEGRRINYDDDLVAVYKDGKEIYKGLEDYEPMKDELWKWDNNEQAYFLDDRRYKKVCLEEAALTESSLTAEEKVDAWHNGTRRENYKAAGIPKLYSFLDIAERKRYDEIVEILKDELRKRGEPTDDALAIPEEDDWEDRVKAADDLLDELIAESDNTDYDDADGYWYTEYDRWCNRYLYYKNNLEDIDRLEYLCEEYSSKLPGIRFYCTEDDYAFGEPVEDPVSEIGYILSKDVDDMDYLMIK